MINGRTKQNQTILVSGATGNQGGAVARQLLAANFPVRALTRDPEQKAAQALRERGAEVVRGDLNDPDSLAQALNGVYGVFSVQNFGQAGGPEGEVKEGKALIDAAKDAGAEHVVYSSVGSADQQTGVPHFDSKFQIEEYLRASGLPHTILRPVAFMDNWEQMGRASILKGTFAAPLEPETRLQQVAVDDIGAFATLAFSKPEHFLGQALDLAGDELTMREMTDTFSRVIGRPVRYVQLPLESVRETMGDDGAKMFRWMNEVGYKADIAALHQLYPELTTFEHYLRSHGWKNAQPPQDA